MHTISVVQILTASIAPVIVISGVGLLLLSVTNRYGRAIDRARMLMKELGSREPENEKRHLQEQLSRMHQRARLLRASMIYGLASILFVSMTILSLFAELVFRMAFDFVGLPLFALSLISLVISIFYSIRDIRV